MCDFFDSPLGGFFELFAVLVVGLAAWLIVYSFVPVFGFSVWFAIALPALSALAMALVPVAFVGGE